MAGPKSLLARRSFPLWLQILGWFFLNLLAVGAIVVGLFTAHSTPVLEAIMSSAAGNRLAAMAADLADRMNSLPKNRWGELTDSIARRYKVDVALVRRDGDTQAGRIPPPPPEVVAKIREFPGPPPPLRPAPPRPQNEAARESDSPDLPQHSPPPPGPRDTGGFRQEPGHQEDREERDARSLHNFRFLLHENELYWIGVRLPLGTDPSKTSKSESARNRGPLTLLIVTPSLLAGGLLLDTAPVWITAALLLGSALFWVPLVRRITIPLRQMRDAAQDMARGQFDIRLELNRGDEIGSLAGSLNHLGARLEEYVSGQKRFLGDIAHELGSPLARMQFALGIVEQNASADVLPLLEDVREEAAQMSELLGEILQFTKAGLHSEMHLEPVQLGDLFQQAFKQENITPEVLDVQIPEGLQVQADAHYLLRAVANILRNAMRYAAEAGPIRIEARRLGSSVAILVADQGPGVPESSIHRLCDPFYRTENSRTRETGGVGLGLAIVKRCVEACGGTVLIRNLKPTGLGVEIRLPLAPKTPGEP